MAFIASVWVFKGDDELEGRTERVMEITEIDAEGLCEFAVDGHKGTRIFLRFRPEDLIGEVMAMAKPEPPK